MKRLIIAIIVVFAAFVAVRSTVTLSAENGLSKIETDSIFIDN